MGKFAGENERPKPKIERKALIIPKGEGGKETPQEKLQRKRYIHVFFWKSTSLVSYVYIDIVDQINEAGK